MHPGLKKQEIDFEVINNGMDTKVTFSIPVFKFIGLVKYYTVFQ